MTLTLYYHPFSSYCQKVLIPLYEGGIAFRAHLVDLGDAEARATFARIWPPAKFPVLRDEGADLTLPESSVIIEYLERLQPPARRMIPDDPDAALEVRLWDRLFDHHVSTPLQRIVAEHLGPSPSEQAIALARAQLETAYDLIEERLRDRHWAAADRFSMADCSAAPALYYARLVAPFGGRPNLDAYLRRLVARPSFGRAVAEARSYRHFFPDGGEKADWIDP